MDSALAARARADLPWRPWEAYATTEIVPLGPPPRPRRRRLPSVAGVGGALGLAVLALSVLPTRDPPTLAAFAQPEPRPLVAPPAPAPEPPATRVKRAAKKRVAPPPPAATTSRASPRRATPKPKAAPAPKRQPPPPAPRRAYTWKPFAGAIYYQVSFLRDGARIYQTQTRTPRIRLPAHLRLGPGRYSWTVRPAILADLGIRLAGPIVRRAFRVRGD